MSSPNQITIFAQKLTGKKVKVTLDKNATIKELKKQINEIDGLEIEKQSLIFMGVNLEDKKRLSDYNLVDGSTVHLVLRLKGGF